MIRRETKHRNNESYMRNLKTNKNVFNEENRKIQRRNQPTLPRFTHKRCYGTKTDCLILLTDF